MVVPGNASPTAIQYSLLLVHNGGCIWPKKAVSSDDRATRGSWLKYMHRTQQRRKYYGRIIAAACFGIQAIGIGTYISYGVFFNPLMSEFGWSRATISGASSVAFFVMGLLGVLVGRLNDKIGPRKLVTIAGVLFGLGHLLMSRLGAVWQLYLFYGIVFGSGLSSIDVIALTTIARWYSRKRGIMTGIVKVGTGAGQFILPLVATALISGYGWRNAYAIIGAAVLMMLTAVAQVLKRDPSQIGLADDWEEAKQADGLDALGEDFSLREAIRTNQLWIIGVVNLFVVFCLMTVLIHVVPHARGIGASAAEAAGILSAIGGVSMAGRFVSGMIIDRIGSKKTMILCFFLLVVSLFWLHGANRVWMLFLFACLYGLAHGGFFTVISPMVAEWFGIGSHGALFGVVVYLGTTGGAIGPIMAGYIFDISGSYRSAFWLITVIAALGFALLLTLKPIRRK